MTRFTVVWDSDLENALANTWMAGDSKLRLALTEVADWIDSNLVEDHTSKVSRSLTLQRASSTCHFPFHMRESKRPTKSFPDDRLVRVTRLVFRSI